VGVKLGVAEGMGVGIAVGSGVAVEEGAEQDAAISRSSGPRAIANGFIKKAGE